jgi:zinc transport system substrate-binding protein
VNRAIAVLSVVLLAAACTGSPTSQETTAPAEEARTRLLVYVVNYPLAYFAERIGGNQVQVEFPAPADGDPAFWSPDAAGIASYQRADLILRNGAGYARWVDRATLPPSKLVDTTAGLWERYLYVESVATHSHGPQGEHSHGEVAFTTWLDPTLALEQARAIHQALLKAWPQGEAAFQVGWEALQQDLQDLDRRLAETVGAGADKPLLASHPVYQYLARRYGLQIESVHFEPDEEPDADDWRGLQALHSKHPARWMLWESAPLQATAQKLLEMGVEAIVFETCGNRPEQGDYLTVMSRNAENLAGVFAGD